MKSSSPFDIGQSFFSINAYSQVTFTNTISLVYTKAIVCSTGKCSCITSVNVCYSPLVPRLLLQINCKLLPSRTVGLLLIPLILSELRAIKKITSKVQE